MRLTASPTISNAGPVTQLRPAGEDSAAAEVPTELDWPRVRGYAVHQMVGSGGMGVVFRATHRELQRVVALKMLMTGSFCEDESRDRFRAEAETVARLQHPNIIQVFEVGTVEALPGEVHPSPFIALEFVDGGSLADQTKVPRPPQLAARMVEKLARAVQVAHKQGIVHRDLKPANVLLTADGEPKVADFGLAKRLDTPRDNSGRFVTVAGTVMGTPEYMAPEQVAGEGPAPSMDVYALGVILYELLTSRVPHHGATPADTMYMTRFEEPVPPRRLQPTLPRDVDTVCMKALAKAPAKRYPSAEALADDLARWLGGRSILARPVSPAGRAVRWAKRNPAVAALSALVVLVAVAGVSGIVWKWGEAKAAAADARANAAEARGNAAAAAENAQNERWGRYRSEMIAASSALQVGEVGGARRALVAASDEYRDWEWRFFMKRLEGQSRTTVLDPADTQGAAFSRDARRLVCVNIKGELSSWDVATGRREWGGLRRTHWGALSINPGANRIAMTLPDNTIEVWSITPPERVVTIAGTWGRVWSAAVSPDGTSVATATDDRVVRIWDVRTGTARREIPIRDGNLGAMEFSPDGGRVVMCGGTDRTARVWDTETGAVRATIRGHDRDVVSAQFTPDGTRIVTNEHYPTNRVWIWDAATGAKVACLGAHDNQVGEVRVSPTGDRMVTSSMDQTARLWDRDGNPVAVLAGHKGRVSTAAFSRDGRRVATVAADRTIRLWDARAGAFLGVVCGHTGDVHRVEFSADGAEVLSVSCDGTLRAWDVRKIEADGKIGRHGSFAYSVAYHPDGKRVASSSWDGTARLWDVDTGRELRSFPHGDNVAVTSVGIHPGGRLMATLSRDKRARVWDIETGRLVHAWAVDANDWRDARLAFSPVGDLLATSERDGSVRLFDARAGAELRPLPARADMVTDVAFSPDGRHLAVGHFNGEARVWDVATRTEVARLPGHAACAYALAYSRDGGVLAVGSADGTVSTWDGRTYARLKAEMKPEAKVYGVAFNREGTRVAAGCADNAIRIFDVKSGDEVGVIRGHGDYVHSLAFSPDGTRLVSASGDFTLRVWDGSPRAKPE